MQHQQIPSRVPQLDANNFLDMIKAKLFKEEKDRKELIMKLRLNSNNFDEALHVLFHETKELDLQFILAPLLRRITIAHMRARNTPYTKGFAAAYEEIYHQQEKPRIYVELSDYFARHEKEYTWSEEAEAGALADFLDITLVVTSITHTLEGRALYSKPFMPRKVADTRPAIHLYVEDNTHWYCYPNDYNGTVGNGNCFYNACAQMLRQIVMLEEAQKELQREVPVIDLTEEQQSAYEYQNHLLAMILNKEPLPMEQLIKNVNMSITNNEKADHDKALSVAFSFIKLPQKGSEQADSLEVEEGIVPLPDDDLETVSLIEHRTSGAIFKSAAQDLQEYISHMPDGVVKTQVANIHDQAAVIVKNKPFTSTPDLTQVMILTLDVLKDPNEANLEKFIRYANKVEGKPSAKMKILGGLMIALGVLLVAAATLVIVGTLGLGLTVGILALTTASVSVTTGAGFFNAGRRKGLSKDIYELHNKTVQASGCDLPELNSRYSRIS